MSQEITDEMVEAAKAVYDDGEWTIGTLLVRGMLEAADRARKPGWQPIDTAPRDGTYVLLWEKDEDGRQVIGWCRPDGLWDSNDGFVYMPLYWMPLPASPHIGAVIPDAGLGEK